MFCFRHILWEIGKKFEVKRTQQLAEESSWVYQIKWFWFAATGEILRSQTIHRMRHWFSFRYDTSSGIFTVPQGGEGLYYFSTYLLLENGESGCFDIRVNGVVLCSACGDEDTNTGDDNSQATCSGITHLQEGGCDPNVNVNLWNSVDSMIFSFVCSSCNVVKILPQQFSQNFCLLKWKSCFYSSDDEVTVVYASGTDTTPLAGIYFSGFSGFRL